MQPFVVAIVLASVPLLATVSAQPEPDGFDDPPDDMKPPLPLQAERAGPGVVPATFFAHADLRRVRVAQDDAHALAIEVVPARLVVDRSVVPNARWNVAVDLKLAATHTFEMQAIVDGRQDAQGFVATGVATVFATFCDAAINCASQPVSARLNAMPGSLWFVVPKDSLMGLDPLEPPRRPPATLASLPKGVEIVIGQVVSRAHVPESESTILHDVAPEVGSFLYRMRSEAANQDLRMQWRPDRVLHVTGGDQRLVPFTLVNANASRRLVELNYTWSGDASGFGLAGPASISAAGNANRSAALWLTIPATMPDVLPRLIVSARSVDGALARSELELRPGLRMDGDRPDLIAHAVDASIRPYCATALPCGDGFLGPQESAPAWIFPRPPPGERGIQSFTLPVSARLAQPHGWKPQPRLTGTLVLHAPVPLENLDVAFSLSTAGGTVFRVATQVSLRQGNNPWPIDLPLPPRPLPSLAREADLVVHVSISTLDSTIGMALEKAPPLVRAGESRLSLPLVAEKGSWVSDEAVPALLRATGAVEDFVNPGESRRLNFSILNPHDELRELGLRVSAPEGYAAELRPGARFRLSGGQELAVAVEVRAPASAVEGEVAYVEIVAGDADQASSPLRFKLTVVSNVDLADDLGRFGDDEDAAAGLVTTPPSTTPGPSWLVAAGLACAWATRGRRPAA